MKKDSILLTEAQRQSLEQVIRPGKSLAWTIMHARVLLNVDRGPQGSGWSTAQTLVAFSVGRSMVERIWRLSFAALNHLALRNAKWMEKPKPPW